MIEIESAEHTIATLNDKLNAATKRVDEIAGERQVLGFAVYADGDKVARVKLDKLNVEMAGLAGEVESIKGAIVE